MWAAELISFRQRRLLSARGDLTQMVLVVVLFVVLLVVAFGASAG